MAVRRQPVSSVLVKPAGPDCNLECEYCFYLDRSALFPQPGPHRMDEAVLEAMIRQTIEAGAPEVSFGWQGGEPTLMGLPFFERAVELQKKYGRTGQTIGNGLQTNGLLINQNWCRFLRDSRFLVGLSLDGPESLHDRYRVTRGKRPSWRRVMDAARMLLDAGVEVNALAVVNDCTAGHGREIYEFLRDAGLRFMQFIPCLEHDPHDPRKPAPFSVGAEQFGRFLCEVFDAWRADFQAGAPTTYVRWFESVFAAYVGMPPAECTLLRECGNYLVIEHNGDVFACDFFVEADWKLGNVRDGRLVDMLNSERQVHFGRLKAELAETCLKCRWLPYCRGGCPKERWGHAGDDRCSRLCEAYKAFFSHADATLQELAAVWRRQQADRLVALTAAAPPGTHARGSERNARCGCGSGKKYKHCCGR